MRGVFDDRELEEAAPRRDTELTLSSVTLLLIAFALVLLCGLCFGLGYSMGNRGSRDPSVAQAPAGDSRATTLADGARPKPSANAQAEAEVQLIAPVASVRASPVAPKEDSPSSSNSSIGSDHPSGPGKSNATGQSSASSQSSASGQSSVPGQSSEPAQWVAVRPALGAGVTPIQPGLPATSAVTPALVPAVSLMVQIAAVSQPEDADVLMSALRRKGYAVVTRRDPLDGLIHVRIGPFKTLDEAEKWRQKLLSDGYNAIVQP